MELTPVGRAIVAALALLVAGFALGSVTVQLQPADAAVLLIAASTLLLIAARRGRNGA